jgi:cytochrome c553
MDYVGLGILVGLTLLFIALAVGSWRARRRWVKIAAGIPTTLLALGGLLASGAAISGFNRINRTYPNPVANVQVELTPERIERGQRAARACAGCHSANGQLPLTGQQFFGGPEGPPFGTLWAPNLHLSSWSDGEIVRAIREGISKDGRSLMIMPSKAFHTMSDEDVQALVAYLRSQPPAGSETPPKALSVMAALTIASSDEAFSAQPPITGAISSPPAGATPEYGQYLSGVMGCRECHGDNLRGAVPPGSQTGVTSPSLVAFGQQYSEDQFVAVLRTGMRPDGTAVDPAEMPWPEFELFSDDDFRAIYRYIKTLG